jgi:nucleoside-diphosphate-sugar epimerase
LKIENIRRILIVGTGTIGQQICLQCAMHGYDVVAYDIAPDSLKPVPLVSRFVCSAPCTATMWSPTTSLRIV